MEPSGQECKGAGNGVEVERKRRTKGPETRK